MIYEIVETHITDIKHGDCIIENGAMVTVSNSHIKRDPFFCATLRGDSYNSGRKQVLKAVIKRAMPNGTFVNA
jgi:hypothetical protein